jgi:NifU-like protein
MDVSTTVASTTDCTPAVRARLARLRFQGELTEGDAKAQDCTVLATAHGAESAPDHINLSLMVDASGVVQDVRYRTPATGDLLAAYDVMAELCVGKPLVDAALITPRQVDAHLRQGAPEPTLHLSEDADKPFYVLTKAAERLTAKPTTAPAPPVGAGIAAELGWPDIGLFEKVRRIEAVLDQHVRPALASDGGGIDLVDLKNDELLVQYHGACGSCSSSIGGTLQFIQDSLNNHLATQLQVKVAGVEMPDFT